MNGEADNCDSDLAMDLSDSYSPVTKALGIHLILKKILENLETCDLLTCRLVSSSWYDLSTNLLQCQQPSPLQITFQHVNGRFTLFQKYPKISPRPLKYFVDLLENSRDHHPSIPFPFAGTSFKFFEGPLDDPELQLFLTDFGENIIDLDLDLFSSNPSHKDVPLIQKLILVQLPNIRHLTLRPPRKIRAYQRQNLLNSYSLTLPLPSSSIDTSMPMSIAVVLPHLVSIQGPEIPTSFMETLVEACPNLQSISLALEVYTLTFLKYLMTSGSGKLGLVKHLVFCPRPNSQNNMIYNYDRQAEPSEDSKWEAVFKTVEDALALNLRPVTLEVDLVRLGAPYNPNLNRKGASLLLKILGYCAQSLEKLKAKLPFFDQSQGHWPIMEGVSFIELYLWEHPGLFLENFDLAVKFPNLQAIKVICKSPDSEGPAEGQGQCRGRDGGQDRMEGRPCPFIGVAGNVKKIEFSECLFPKSYLRLLPHVPAIFPNLEELTIENIEDFTEVGAIVWACRKLKILKLTLKLGGENNANTVDSVFTGFSVETCELLGNQTMESLLESKRMDVDSLRENFSIVNLKELKRLTIKLLVSSDLTVFPRVMSTVTRKYGFDCLPNLIGKVNIFVEVRPWGDVLSREKYEKVRTALADIAPCSKIFDFYDTAKHC